jgi:hypothetical protein
LGKDLEGSGVGVFLDLRPSAYFCQPLTEAGVSPIFVAQIMGHSNPNILKTYARAINEFRRSAILKLEASREARRNKLPFQSAESLAAIQ